MFCTKCGQELGDDDLFCTNCGTRVKRNEEPEAEATESAEPTDAGEIEATTEPDKTEAAQAPEHEDEDAGLTTMPDEVAETAPTNVMPAKETTVLPSDPAPQPQPQPQPAPQPAPAADVTTSYSVMPQQVPVVAAPPQQPKPTRAPLIVAVCACVVAAIACVVMVLHVTGAAPWVSKQAPDTAAATSPETPAPAPATPAAEPAPAQQQPTVVVQPIVISTDGGQQTTVSNNDYVLPDSASRYYSESSLSSLSNWQLFVARNEIYARHGRRFLRDDLQSYFNSKSWYHGTVAPENFNDGVLNDVERSNALTMRSIEESRGSEYLN